ncbi:LysR substrate-binding domain-containing protein [Kitasatospora kifunensis]|uniref:DNA-binding transcriptional LysR family regulator n=1 Tax=Kitasatospora kifunensis TaxID=58351 RepID=A0A7W7RBL7_KITKI|nr:LysR substrate-binding domain-containing protein [Kitasatospora kifunensis]MBB4928968.1 DNA-binding transcriptional LysR family regulator [Kitasatospora kifunensis]
MELTPRLLEQFVVLAEEQHFGHAARRLSMSQPPLSQAIQRLERGLGVLLLERTSRGVQLTAAGAAFAADAKRLLEAQSAAVARARRISRGVEGTVQLGYVSSLGYWHLPRLLTVAAREVPDIRLNVRQRNSAELAEQVRQGAVDLALVRLPVTDLAGLQVLEVAEERTVLAVPLGHPLAGAACVPLSRLRDEEFVTAAPQAMSQLHELIQDACQEAGFVPRSRAQGEDLTSMLGYTAAGVCVSLVPERVAALGHPMVRFVPLEGGDRLVTTVAALSRPTADPAVALLLELMERHRPEIEGPGAERVAQAGESGETEEPQEAGSRRHQASGEAPSGSAVRARRGLSEE